VNLNGLYYNLTILLEQITANCSTAFFLVEIIVVVVVALGVALLVVVVVLHQISN